MLIDANLPSACLRPNIFLHHGPVPSFSYWCVQQIQDTSAISARRNDWPCWPFLLSPTLFISHLSPTQASGNLQVKTELDWNWYRTYLNFDDDDAESHYVLEQGATGPAGLEALGLRRNAAQTHNCLCPKDLCGTVAPVALVCVRRASGPSGRKAAWHLPPWRYKHHSSANLR